MTIGKAAKEDMMSMWLMVVKKEVVYQYGRLPPGKFVAVLALVVLFGVVEAAVAKMIGMLSDSGAKLDSWISRPVSLMSRL
jgi:hypothetical protein